LPESLPRYRLPAFSTAWSIYLQDTLVYVADGDSGLRIINVTNPAAPYEVSHFPNPPGGSATGVFIKDTIAYLGTWGGGFRILNIANPTIPFEIGYHADAILDVVVIDTIAYTTSNLGFTKIFNVANPTNPTLIGYYLNPDLNYRLFVSNNLIYVVCYESGISILQYHQTGINEEYLSNKIDNRCNMHISNNPIKNKCRIVLNMPRKIRYRLNLFDLQGREILSIFDGKSTGITMQEFNVHRLSAGIYFIVLRINNQSIVKKVVVVH
jgi:hypothetical protein